MGTLESREINASYPQWKLFETSKEEDQTVLMLVFSEMSLDFALNICGMRTHETVTFIEYLRNFVIYYYILMRILKDFMQL